MTLLEKAASDFRSSLWAVMQDNRIDVDWIAKSVGLSKANFMQRVFKSNHNFRLEALVKLAEAVGGRLRIEVVPARQVKARRIEAGAADR